MKKVLFTATVDSHILQFHLPFLKLFKENGYEVHVATNGNKVIPYCDVKHVVTFERNPFKLNNLKAIKQLKKICNEEKFDIIHTHTPMGSVVTRIAAIKTRKKYNTRVIYTAHGLHFFKGAPIVNWLIYYPVEKILSRYTDTLILINQEDYDLCKSKFKKCRDIQYVPGVGINKEKFNINLCKNNKKKIRESLGLSEDDFVMIYVARMDKNKNQGMLINCTEELVKKYQNVKLLLVGPDERNGYYQDLVSKKKLNNNVIFLGFRKDIPNLMKISDIALSSSKREGLPINVLEAFEIGLPVVAYDCRGTRDLIRNGVNGYIVDSESEMLSKVIELYNSISLRKKIGNNNIKIADNYDISKVIRTMRDIYCKKKSVLHVLTSNSFSGAENVACLIISNMNNEYDEYYCCPDGKINEQLRLRNINHISIKKLTLHNLKKIINIYNPDIIHAHDNTASVIASIALLNNRYTKLVFHIHGNNKIMNTFNLKTFLFLLCSCRANRIIWVSDSSLNGYVFNKALKRKSIILYNVVDKKMIDNKSKEYKITNKHDIIFLGRLAYPKNPERFINIVEKIKTKRPSLSVGIVGDGVDKEKVEKMVVEKGLSNTVTFYGFKKNPYPILKNSTLLVMTSIYEGTPMCALEAQALGKTIVATPVDGLKKIVINDVNGYLSNDDKELVDKILELLENTKKRKTMEDKTKKKFSDYNDINKYCDAIRESYRVKK